MLPSPFHWPIFLQIASDPNEMKFDRGCIESSARLQRLADARTRGKQILRLRIVMDEGGWTLTPGTTKEGKASRLSTR